MDKENDEEQKLRKTAEGAMNYQDKAAQRYMEEISADMEIYSTFIIAFVSGFLASSQIFLNPEIVSYSHSGIVKVVSRIILSLSLLIFVVLAAKITLKWWNYKKGLQISRKQLEFIAESWRKAIEKFREDAHNPS